MPKLFVTGIVLFLLLGVEYGITQAARHIPWDCSDWEAFAHEDRETAILESLAANRGKTLYCGIDQSDTFAKAETWQAGKDRNERDDTVYWGEGGSFRGFIAAQEGWLTDGESGVTGVSIDRIFEFPKAEKKRRRERYKPNLRYGKSYPTSTLSVPRITSANNPGGPVNGYLRDDRADSNTPNFSRGPRTSDNGYVRAFGPLGATADNAPAAAANARESYRQHPPTAVKAASWAQDGYGDPDRGLLEVPGGAAEECAALGYNRATRVKWWYYDSDGDGTPDLYVSPVPGTTIPNLQYRAFRIILYTALCRN